MTEYERAFCNYLSGFLTDERKAKFKEVIASRTRYLTVVLEDIFQPQNASAVVRTCDCFGVQNLHIIENRNAFTINPDVVVGASKWVDINYYNQQDQNTAETLLKLKSEGYRIVATSPHKNDVMLEDLDLEKGKIALVFGTERRGISDVVRAHADEFVKIPMHGFTESYNISVSVALCIYHISAKLRHLNVDWHLTEEEKEDIIFRWVKSSTKLLYPHETAFDAEYNGED